MTRVIAVACWVAMFAGGCRRAHQVGDHVLVDWRGGEYSAVIVGVEGPAKFRVHFDGYSDDWDESIPATRVKARLSTTANVAVTRGAAFKSAAQPSATATASGRPPASANTAPPPMYHVGDRVRVEWHGSIYAATIIASLGDDRYRIHYEGYGSEWDETIGTSRIQRKH